MVDSIYRMTLKLLQNLYFLMQRHFVLNMHVCYYIMLLNVRADYQWQF